MSADLNLGVRRSGRQFEAEAVFELAADAAAVWNTITDYPALPQFMPGIRACRVVQRKPGTGKPAPGAPATEHLVVEQEGEFRFMVFAQTMTVRLDIEHRHQQVAHAKATRFELGIFKRSAIDVFEGRYELTPLDAKRDAPRTQLRYTALIGLRLPPPPAVGSVAVRQNLAAQLQAVAAEVARRRS